MAGRVPVGVVAGVATAAVLFAGTAGATPPGPAPIAGRGGPPPAWVETSSASRWLAFSGYCWDSVCVRPRSPATRNDLPVLRVTAGRTLRLHFGFAARGTSVTVAGSRSTALPAGKLVSWRVARKGISVISTTAPGHGTVSYVVVIS